MVILILLHENIGLNETLLMWTTNICFLGEIRKMSALLMMTVMG